VLGAHLHPEKSSEADKLVHVLMSGQRLGPCLKALGNDAPEHKTCAVMSGEGLGASHFGSASGGGNYLLVHIPDFSEGSVDSIAQRTGRF
jgi:hypothetical protein